MSETSRPDIRMMHAGDTAEWAAMRHALWPEDTIAEHAEDIATALAEGDYWGFLTEDGAGKPIGFAEVSLRDFADGCVSLPVPYLEGIRVDAGHRRSGIGQALLAHVEAFVRARGFVEIGSDVVIDNVVSQAAHAAWGFVETERIICYCKPLG